MFDKFDLVSRAMAREAILCLRFFCLRDGQERCISL